ncbi:MAG: pyridoxamine 5'-phosphate oxidase [Verrucomicrobiales bacterium]
MSDPTSPEAEAAAPNLAHLREEYSRERLDESDVAADPVEQFHRWLDEARAAQLPEPNAMSVATIGKHGLPNVRILLLKGADTSGFTFFTNYESHKGQELAANPGAALLFLWKELERQVIIRGLVQKTSRAESEAYFKTRPYGSQIGAHASIQSTEIPDREWLEKRYAELSVRYPEGEVPCPPNWGGYRLVPAYFEFWQGRRSRLHDRICFDHGPDGRWRIFRRSP